MCSQSRGGLIPVNLLAVYDQRQRGIVTEWEYTDYPGFISLGAMGSPMAPRLISAGYKLPVIDMVAERMYANLQMLFTELVGRMYLDYGQGSTPGKD